jgi:hypothetical protein
MAQDLLTLMTVFRALAVTVHEPIDDQTNLEMNMATLKIHDLSVSRDLDAKARAVIRGGISFGWIRPYVGNQSSPVGHTFIGQINVSNTFLLNPVFSTTYNTVNQLEFVTIDVAENVDSLIAVDVAQGQAAKARALPFSM